VKQGNTFLNNTVIGYFAYTDDDSKVASTMISDDNNPPSSNPKSYPNFVAFDSEEISISGSPHPSLCTGACNWGYFPDMTVSYMNAFKSEVKFKYFVGDNYKDMFAISGQSKKKYTFT